MNSTNRRREWSDAPPAQNEAHTQHSMQRCRSSNAAEQQRVTDKQLEYAIHPYIHPSHHHARKARHEKKKRKTHVEEWNLLFVSPLRVCFLFSFVHATSPLSCCAALELPLAPPASLDYYCSIRSGWQALHCTCVGAGEVLSLEEVAWKAEFVPSILLPPPPWPFPLSRPSCST